MLRSKIAKAQLEENQRFFTVEEDSTVNISSSESLLLNQFDHVLTGDEKMMMMMGMSSFQNSTNHQFGTDDYGGVIDFEQQGTMIKDVDQFSGLPVVSSIGDLGMVLPTCYDNINLYPYNDYYYSTMLGGGGGDYLSQGGFIGGGGDYLSQGGFIGGSGNYLSQGGLIGGGSPTMTIREDGGLGLNVDYHDLLLGPVDYYSGPPPDLCY